ncbi:MAG: hypothetical protein P1T08_12490 [Acidimicrobiia bacterium]|nr:hypothetical protein [Acidimicrobiia bacterium]
MNLAKSSEDLHRLVESATRFGIEMDEQEALRWLMAMSLAEGSTDIVVDAGSGVFGHRISMLDFSPHDLAYIRTVETIVEIQDRAGVETAVALSGSAAQSKIQTFPGDCDFFERVNILAATRQEACEILGDLVLQKALSTLEGETYRLIEVKFGEYPESLCLGDLELPAGSLISWDVEALRAGAVSAFTSDGSPRAVTWAEAARQPGWCKLDWVVADPVRGHISNASNMLDATWESPDGAIVPLDGYLDPYFQEVYLEADSIPLFSKIVKQVSTDALDTYVGELEAQVRKYVGHEPKNFGKAAKRMYNIFRLQGRYEEASFLRELFDEPATVLYQVWSLLRSLEEAADPGSPIDRDTVLRQADELILTVVRTLEGDAEAAIVTHLLLLRDSISRDRDLEGRSVAVASAREDLVQLVNDYFYDRITAVPALRDYVMDLESTVPPVG